MERPSRPNVVFLGDTGFARTPRGVPMTTLKALEIWSAQSLCDAGIFLSVVSWLLYLARPYFARIRGELPLKIAADMWWLWYVVVRDGSLFGAFVAGLWTLNLDLMADIKIGLPFVPVGTVLIAGALALKVHSEGNARAMRLAGHAIALAAIFNVVGYVFVMEGPGPEYAAAGHPVWRTLAGWRSNANPWLSTVTFYATFTALVGIALAAVLAAGKGRGVDAAVPRLRGIGGH
jgi:hypothetical protein